MKMTGTPSRKTLCAAADLADVRGIFFDLDGTLLDVEMSAFIPAYLKGLAASFADVAPADKLVEVLLDTTWSLLRADDGSRTNEEAYLLAVQQQLGIPPDLYRHRLTGYFREGLAPLEEHVRPLPVARDILQICFNKGLKVVVATNPVFPRPVVDARLAWGGLLGFPFQQVTSYENSRYCKPNPRYFTTLLAELGLQPGETIMVGNDTEHDLAARQAGIRTFLVDTWLEDRTHNGFVTDYRGSHQDLLAFVEDLGEKTDNN